MAEALYRKYRPQIFEDVVGQEHIQRTIKNAIETDKVSHAYLFCGPRGTGKTTTARLLAKALMCEKGPTSEPDGICEDCELIAVGEHPDVYELDAASRTGVENVREEIIGRVQYAPTRGRYKIYIIDEVHMLSTAAFNALLKTLEEPPSHVVFILATTDPQMVPETIHSRCQRFDFRRISTEEIITRLGAICVSEGVEFEGEALDLVAHRAEGGMRNALTSLEQLIAFGEGKVSLEVAERMLGALSSNDLAEIVGHVGRRDVAACFRWTAEFVETGADLAQFTRDFAEHMRNMYVMSLAGVDVALDVSEGARRELAAELEMYGPERLARMLGVLGDLTVELKTSMNPRLSFEIALTRMVRPQSELTLEGLAERVEELEKRGVGVAAAGGLAGAQSLEQSCSHESATGAFGSCGTRLVSAGEPARREPAGQRPASQQGAAYGETFADVGGPAGQGAGGHAGSEPAARVEPAHEVALAAERQQAASAQVGADQQVLAQVQSGSVSRESEAQSCEGSQQAASAGGGSVSAEFAASMRNPAALQRMWQTALAGLKREKAAYGVLFLNTKASFNEAAGALIIEFPAENDFAFKAVQKPDVQDELASALAQAAGESLPFRLMKAGSGGAAFSAGAGAASGRGDVAAGFGAQPQRQDRSQAQQMRQQPQVQAQRPQTQQPGAQSAQSQQARPQSQQQPRQSQSQAAYDEVPVDLYDDMAGYGDYDDPGYYDDFASLQPTGASAQPQRVQQHAQQQVSQWQSQPQPDRPLQRSQAAPSAESQPQGRTAASQAAAQVAAQRQVEPVGATSAGAVPTEALSAGAAPAGAPSEVARATGPASSGVPADNDIEAALAYGFGAGITFTEVDG